MPSNRFAVILNVELNLLSSIITKSVQYRNIDGLSKFNNINSIITKEIILNQGNYCFYYHCLGTDIREFTQVLFLSTS